MTAAGQRPDLELLAARQLADLLENVAIGASVPISSSSDICDTLELWIPQVLRVERPEWERESIDGFYFSHAVKRGSASAQFAGTCILIRDQAVTPFWLDLTIADDSRLRPSSIRLGEPGNGPLGISGPGCNSRAASELLAGIEARMDRIDWVYSTTMA